MWSNWILNKWLILHSRWIYFGHNQCVFFFIFTCFTCVLSVFLLELHQTHLRPFTWNAFIVVFLFRMVFADYFILYSKSAIKCHAKHRFIGQNELNIKTKTKINLIIFKAKRFFLFTFHSDIHCFLYCCCCCFGEFRFGFRITLIHTWTL